MTTLKDFVHQTLAQIAEGVAAFEEDNKGTEITARPDIKTSGNLAGNSTSEAGLIYLGGGAYASLVRFDVILTEEDSEGAKAGGGLKVWFATAEGNLESAKGNSATNRMQFTLPLKLKDAAAKSRTFS